MQQVRPKRYSLSTKLYDVTFRKIMTRTCILFGFSRIELLVYTLGCWKLERWTSSEEYCFAKYIT